MIPSGSSLKFLLMMATNSSPVKLEVPNVSTRIDVGCATPIA